MKCVGGGCEKAKHRALGRLDWCCLAEGDRGVRHDDHRNRFVCSHFSVFTLLVRDRTLVIFPSSPVPLAPCFRFLSTKEEESVD